MKKFDPSYTYAPSDYLWEYMVEQNIEINKIIYLAGWSSEYILKFLRDEIYVDEEVAKGLCMIAYGDQEYWIRLQKQYYIDKAKGRKRG